MTKIFNKNYFLVTPIIFGLLFSFYKSNSTVNSGYATSNPNSVYDLINSSSGDLFTLTNSGNIIKNSNKNYYSRQIVKVPANGINTYHNGQVLLASDEPRIIKDGKSFNVQNSYLQYGYSMGTNFSDFSSVDDKTFNPISHSFSISLPANIINSNSINSNNYDGQYQIGFNLNNYNPDQSSTSKKDYFVSSAPFGVFGDVSLKRRYIDSFNQFVAKSPKNTSFSGSSDLSSIFDITNTQSMSYIKYDIIHSNIQNSSGQDYYYFCEYATDTHFENDATSDDKNKNYESPIAIYGQFTKNELINNDNYNSPTKLGNFLSSTLTNNLYNYGDNYSDYAMKLFNLLKNNDINLGNSNLYTFLASSSPLLGKQRFETDISTIADPLVDNQALNSPSHRSMYKYNLDGSGFQKYPTMLYLSYLTIANGGTATNGPSGGSSGGGGDDSNTFTSSYNVESGIRPDPHNSWSSIPLFININSGRYLYPFTYNPLTKTNLDSTSYCYPLFNPTLTVSPNGSPHVEIVKEHDKANIWLSTSLIIVIFVLFFVILPLYFFTRHNIKKKKSKN